MKNKMKVIISTGQGRLHLIESAKSLIKLGIDIKIITGWVPSKKISDNLINFFGTLIGRKNLASGLRKRNIENFDDENIFTCSFSEFYIQFLFFLSNYKVLKRDSAAISGWKLYGWQSKKHLKDVTIFHVRSGAGQGGAIERAKNNGLKVIVDHSIAHPKELNNQILKSLNGNSDDPSLNTLKRFWKLVLKDCSEADVIVVNSDYVKDSFIENGFSADKISVIPLGIKKEFWKLKKNYLIKGESKLLFTGGFGRRKGAQIIIEAFNQLNKISDRYTLDVLGSVMNDIETPEWFKNHKNVNLHGHIPQEKMFSFLKKSDIYIFPSYSEGAAQSLKEAMAAGLPVIATYQSGAPIEHMKNGIIIKDHCVSSLIKAIMLLNEDSNLREYLGRNAAKTIQDSHTWDNYGKQLLKIYKRYE
jgi:glycosyltransferase involved in cell wall biosynthesis